MALLIIGITSLLGFYMAWTIGANDFANSMGDAVGARAITISQAVVLGALCEFGGAFLVGAHVTDTVRKGIVNPLHLAAAPEVFALGMICALLACALWLHLASWWGMPVSTTHSIVGGIAGFGLVAVGWHAVEWRKMAEIVTSWVISPLAGGLLAYAVFQLIRLAILGRDRPLVAARRYAPLFVFGVIFVITMSVVFRSLDRLLARFHLTLTDRGSIVLSLVVAAALAALSRWWLVRYLGRDHERRPLQEQLHRVERTFIPLVVLSSCSVAFAHGANDVANAIGPLAAVADVVRTGAIKISVSVPPWILSLGGAGIIAGLATYGHRVLATIGSGITQLTPSRGVAADVATATTVLVCSRLKLPVSTTHTIVGAVIGISFARGLGSVNGKVVREIVSSWLITIPAAAILTAGLFYLGRVWGVDQLIRQAMP